MLRRPGFLKTASLSTRVLSMRPLFWTNFEGQEAGLGGSPVRARHRE